MTKKDPPAVLKAPTQHSHETHQPHEPRPRKHSSAPRPLPRRDSPSSNSPASSSPKSQPRKLVDPVDLVTVPQLDNSLPSDSRYPLPSRSSSRSTPSPALNSSSRASPTVDMPDGGKGSPAAKEVTSSTRVTPRGPKPQPQRSIRYPGHSAPTPSISPPPAIMDTSGPAYQHVPVRGRPLIFAAMSVAPSEIADIEEPAPEEEMDLGGDSHDVSQSTAPYGYPSPTSTGRKSPQKFETSSEATQPLDLDTRKPRKLSKKKAVPPMATAAMQNPVDIQPAHHDFPPSHQHQHRLHHHNHHGHGEELDLPQAPLGPAFQLQSAPQSQPGHHGNSSGEESPRKRPVPLEQNKSARHGVKTLTGKQLEKLNRRSVHNVNGIVYREKEAPIPLQAPSNPYPQPVVSPPPIPPPKQLPTPPTPPSPEEYARARSQRRGHTLDKSRAPLRPPPTLIVTNPDDSEVASSCEDVTAPMDHDEPPAPQFYPLVKHIADPVLLSNLLCYLAYFEWCQLAAVSKEIRVIVAENRELEELVLERYLRTVGYDRWCWKQPEPLKLSLQVSPVLAADRSCKPNCLQDLSDYMRGVSIPSHQYARTADAYLQRDSAISPITMQELSASCRAFSRVVLRLRAQAEAEAEHNAKVAATMPQPSPPPLPNGNSTTQKPSKWSSRGTPSRSSSRAPSPTSSFSHSHGYANSIAPSQRSGPVNMFRSPLFRPRRAPLLQVFVPSPEGDWLSDASVLECEAELKRAGVLHCLRAGDVVWDVAVGDEGNVGRLVWDGSYLIVGRLAFSTTISLNSFSRTWITLIHELAICLGTCPLSLSRRRTFTE